MKYKYYAVVRMSGTTLYATTFKSYGAALLLVEDTEEPCYILGSDSPIEVQAHT